MPVIVDANQARLHILPRPDDTLAPPACQITELAELDFWLARSRDGSADRAKGQSRVISRSDGTMLLEVTPRRGLTHSRIVAPDTSFQECWRWLRTVFDAEAAEHDRDPSTDDSQVAFR